MTKKEESENSQKIITINLYSIVENFNKYLPIGLVLFVCFNYLYNFLYFINFDLSMINLLKLSDYYEGGASYFCIFCVFVTFVYLCKTKVTFILKIIIDLVIYLSSIIFLFVNITITQSINFIPLFVILILICSLFLKFNSKKIYSDIVNIILMLILFANFNFLFNYNNQTNAVTTNTNDKYQLVRQISDGALVKNKDGNIVFYKWEKLSNIEYSVLKEVSIDIKNSNQNHKIRIINGGPSLPIYKKYKTIEKEEK